VRDDRMPMSEHVTHEPIIRDLEERIHGDRFIALDRCPRLT